MNKFAEMEYKAFKEGQRIAEESIKREYNAPRYFGRFSNKHLDWAYYASLIFIGMVIGITWFSVMRFIWSF